MIIIFRSNSKLGHVGSKTRSLGQILEKKHLVYTLEGSFDSKVITLVRMLIIIISRSSLKLGHGGSETRSLGHILKKPCVHSRGHSFDSKFMKLNQSANDHNI